MSPCPPGPGIRSIGRSWIGDARRFIVLIGGESAGRTRSCSMASSWKRLTCSGPGSCAGDCCSCTIRDNCARLDSSGYAASSLVCAASPCACLFTGTSAAGAEYTALVVIPAFCEPRVDQPVSWNGCCSLFGPIGMSVVLLSRMVLHERWFG